MRVFRFLPDATLFWQFLRDPAADWKPKAAAVAALLYMVWPADLIPDIAPLLGWLDDLGLAAIAAAYLIHRISQYRRP